MTWLVVALAVIALVAIGAYMMEKRRSTALKQRFGPEYDRALDEHGDRRAAEAHLRHRLKRRDEVELAELSPADRERHETRWRVVQAGFVDDPAGSVVEAEALVEQLMNERGYASSAPDADQDGDDVVDRYEVVAVDHPQLVQNHRAARGVAGIAPVDDLRQAFLHHRALFRALLGPAEADASGPDADRDRGREAAVVRS